MSVAVIQTFGGQPQTLTSGGIGTLRGDAFGGIGSSETLARYSLLTHNNHYFHAYAAAVATSLVGTAMVGLQLWNSSPTSGGVNLAITKVTGSIVVTSATTTSLVLATGTGQVSAPSSQTAITRQTNGLIGGPLGYGLAYNAGTFTNAPTALWELMHNTAAIGTTGEDPGFLIDFEGSIEIPPQSYACIAAVGGAVAASGSNLAIAWIEVPNTAF